MDVRNTIKEDGWHVVWGVNLDEIEYVKLASAVAASTVSGGAALATYFQEYLYRTINKVQKQAPQIGRKMLEEILIQALVNPGKLLQVKNLQIRAGIATYDRWLEFPYPALAEWPPPKCDWINIPGMGRVEGYCIKIGMKTFESNLPNHQQPYIKFRFDNGTIPEPDSGVQPDENRVYFEREIPSSEPVGVDLVLRDETIHGTKVYGAKRSITAGPAFHIEEPGDVTFRAGNSIRLMPGFWVKSGSRFRASIDPVLSR
jgi:hypothetical protein